MQVYEEVYECDEIIGVSDSVGLFSSGRGDERVYEDTCEPRIQFFAGSELSKRPRELLPSEGNLPVSWYHAYNETAEEAGHLLRSEEGVIVAEMVSVLPEASIQKAIRRYRSIFSALQCRHRIYCSVQRALRIIPISS